MTNRRAFPSEVILAVLEARLEHHRPAEALGIANDASNGEACTTYQRMMVELARFIEHPTLGARATVAIRRARYALLAFLRGWRDIDYPSIGMTRRR